MKQYTKRNWFFWTVIALITFVTTPTASSGNLTLDELCLKVYNTNPIERDSATENIAGRNLYGRFRVLSITENGHGTYHSVMHARYRCDNGIRLVIRAHADDALAGYIEKLSQYEFSGTVSHITPLDSSFSHLSVDIILREAVITGE